MKTIKLLSGLITSAAIAALILISCEKENTSAISDEILQVSEDDALATTIFDDVFEDAENALTSLQLKSTDAIICRGVDYEWKDDTLIVTITYDGDCLYEFNNNPHWKSGKIIIKRTGGRYYVTGSTMIITFEDYYVDSVKIEGTKKIVSQGYNADSTSITYDITLQGGKLTFPDGTFMTRDGVKTRVLYFDENDVVDHYLVNGTATGLNIFGEAYSRTLTDLRIEPGCPFILSGTVIIEIEGKEPVTIDYGDGTCDSWASVTRNGETKEMRLRLRWHRRIRVSGK
jgi:archaellum component FlaF (FlaF/FlaG flagellin family)